MIDPISEAEYRLRLANEHLGRAEAYYGMVIGLDAYTTPSWPLKTSPRL